MLTSGIISLTTDFGTDDPYVGIMKGVILGRCPTARIIDLTHRVPAYRPEIAGLWLGLSCSWFPAGSIHVAVVDPGVGTDRDIMLLASRDCWFIVPDNGLAAEIARHVAILSRRRVEASRPPATPISATFHGRDLFAPLAASLAAAEISPEDVGPDVSTLVPSPMPVARRSGDRVTGEILLADHFGNLLTNIPRKLLGESRIATVQSAGSSFRFVRTYGDASRNEAVALINSFELLELAHPCGDAERSLALPPGQPVAVSLSD